MRRQHVLSSAAQGIAAKLSPKFAGPFRIEKVLYATLYELLSERGAPEERVHDPWERVFRRYYNDFCVIGERELNFWDDVAEALRSTPMRVERPHQAVVRDFPATTNRQRRRSQAADRPLRGPRRTRPRSKAWRREGRPSTAGAPRPTSPS
ncbi:uncharacterized protein LOC116851975 [Odontomachus brunneus]|uniref:uncharacterized protein LOC116851975 n=1 Tax=Odontomachus brunneus TaxID=486640 RepID=UPI0013F1CEE3|nr:uncharacterized protein LOC116851975 [Odontomachus brunneus]